MYSMLGSQFETSLRLLLLLEAVCNESLTEDTIAALDFITLYSHDFDVTESNLHGDSKYRFGEFPARRQTAKFAIKQLVLDRLIEVSRSSDGFKYMLSNDGIEFISNLDSVYADDYYETAVQVIAMTGKSGRSLVELINRRAITAMWSE